MNKPSLRSHYRELRRALPASERVKAATAAAEALLTHPAFMKGQAIAPHVSFRDEFETAPLINLICETKRCYLPRLTEEGALIFARYQPGDRLLPNAYGILESAASQEICDPRKLDMVLLPLIAFDAKGHRLGTGGGYYDRTFAFIKTMTASETRPHLAGVGYALQETSELPADPWDVALDSMITERGLRFFS